MPPYCDQDVGSSAERRIGGDAGIAVRAAALERHHQFARRHVGARDDRQGGSTSLDHRVTRAFDGLAGAARLLDRQVWKWSSSKPYLCFSRPICMTSQPSPMKIAAATFGCVA